MNPKSGYKRAVQDDRVNKKLEEQRCTTELSVTMETFHTCTNTLTTSLIRLLSA